MKLSLTSKTQTELDPIYLLVSESDIDRCVLTVIELSEEEKKQIMMTEEFTTFFNKTSRIVERALDEDIDIFVDYAGGEGEDMERCVGINQSLLVHVDFNKLRTWLSMDTE